MGTTVGIIGGGQLGRMLCIAGYPLGLRFAVLDPSPEAGAGPLGLHLVGDYDDVECLDALADACDVVTYEFENVPVDAVESLRPRVPVFPAPLALGVAQDRLEEKRLFDRLGIATAPYAMVDSLADLRAAVGTVGRRALLKTRRLGYDGKGQFRLGSADQVDAAWEAVGRVPCILEGFVPFDRELSIIAVRGADGATAFYPLAENHHREGILRLSLAPAPHADALQARAEELAGKVLAALEYVGVLAIELFERDGELLANEMAPRVHNSGHWTIEGAETSQFENHLRVVCGLPLGSTAPVGHSAMVNLIGALPPVSDVLARADSHLHLYAKQPRPGRKVGHITVRSRSAAARQTALEALAPLLPKPDQAILIGRPQGDDDV